MRKLKYIMLLLSDISLVYCVPPDYCNRPLNTSDCKGKPTRVFAYYKPGSRCEIETWKGCPTQNKFPSEIACVNLCIFRFNGERNAETRVNDIGSEKLKIDYDDIPYVDSTENDIPKLCQGKLNTTKCQETSKTVFTYDHEEERCIEANWYVCPTKNMFSTRQQCIKTCEDQNEDLIHFLKQKTTRDFVLLDKLLNDIVDNIAVVDESEHDNDKQKLHNEVVVTEATTLETVASTITSTEKSKKAEPVTEDITTITIKLTETTRDKIETDKSEEVKSTTITETQATTEVTTATEASFKTEKVTETERTTITEIAKEETIQASTKASTAPTEAETSKVTETLKPETSRVTETVKPETSPVTSKPTTKVTSKATEPPSKATTVRKKPTEVIILSDDENEMPMGD